jgi:hypothetical protein
MVGRCTLPRPRRRPYGGSTARPDSPLASQTERGLITQNPSPPTPCADPISVADVSPTRVAVGYGRKFQHAARLFMDIAPALNARRTSSGSGERPPSLVASLVYF